MLFLRRRRRLVAVPIRDAAPNVDRAAHEFARRLVRASRRLLMAISVASLTACAGGTSTPATSESAAAVTNTASSVILASTGHSTPGDTSIPSVTLVAVPSTVSAGAASILTWSAAGATSCTASGGWSGAEPIRGSASTGALSSSATFAMTCVGPSGAATQSTTVTISTPPPPTLSLQVSANTINSGQFAILAWQSTNAQSCAASGGWSGTEAPSGSASTGALTASTTYTLTCSGPGGQTSQSATVSVTAPSSPTGGLTITSGPTLAAATVGAPYSYTMSASGGTAPYTWSFVRDRPLTLAWLTVNEWSLSSAGVLSSILNPSAEETATLVIQVKDAAGNTATGNFYIPVTGVAITTPMKLGVVGVGASFTGGAPLATMAASGGSGNYSWSLASQSGGSNSWSVTSGGAITGNPTHVETDTLVISATDTATGQTVSNNFYVSVVGAVTAARPSYNRGTGLFVLNGELYDPSGTVFRLRGIDRAHFDSNPQPGFQKTGANSTRMFMYTVNGSIPASTYASTAQSDHIAHGEVPIIAMAQFPDGTQTTGNGSTSEFNAGVGWWTANYSAFASIQKYMILNIANEWGPSNSAVWSNAYISAVAALRAAGYTCPIMIDAGGSGQDINDIVNFSGAVFNSDPQKNLIFAFHFYGLSQGYPYSTVAMLQSISGKLAALKSSVGAAYAFTEFGPGYAIGPAPTNLSPGQIVTTAESYGLGTIAWAWDDNDQGDGESDNNWFSFTYAGGFTTQSDLTIFGQDMVLNPYLGIQTNSALPMGF